MFITNPFGRCQQTGKHWQQMKQKKLAAAKGLTPQTYMYAFLMSLGYVTPLSGTTSPIHMAHDVAIMERMQGGEEIFTTKEQLHFAKMLGMPGDRVE
mmetsp:Transcript_14397/g.14232  ORF Transcript_14397/g.14232 Transcript_14397/m.14232 type:complete len:97 (+) Transcript_14397:764-1054(+)